MTERQQVDISTASMFRAFLVLIAFLLLYLLSDVVIILLFAIVIAGSLDTVQSQAPQYFDVVAELQNVLETIASWLQQFSQSALNLAVSAFGGIISFLAALVLSFYLSVMRNGVENFLSAVTPERYEAYIVAPWKRVGVKGGLWLPGQLLLALI